jgi:hypothetical protein
MEDYPSASPCRYIGLDIHKYYSVVTGVDREGEELLPGWKARPMPAT